MTDHAERSTSYLPTAPVITLGGRHGIGGSLIRTGVAVPASGANPFASGDLLAFPFVLTQPVTTIYKGFWVNGSSVANNAAIAVYDADFVLLGQSSSTALSGASVPQVVSSGGIAMKLQQGLYYCALAHDSATTNRFFRWTVATTGAGFWKMAGCWKQASVTLATLPNPATPVACTAVSFPLFGLITRSNFDV